MYEYRAKIERVIDGDTVVALIDLGLEICVREKVRLYGINAPELHGTSSPAGGAAKAYLLALIESFGSDVLIRTHKDQREKYGRYLAELIGHRDGAEFNINEAMVRD